MQNEWSQSRAHAVISSTWLLKGTLWFLPANIEVFVGEIRAPLAEIRFYSSSKLNSANTERALLYHIDPRDILICRDKRGTLQERERERERIDYSRSVANDRDRRAEAAEAQPRAPRAQKKRSSIFSVADEGKRSIELWRWELKATRKKKKNDASCSGKLRLKKFHTRRRDRVAMIIVDNDRRFVDYRRNGVNL